MRIKQLEKKFRTGKLTRSQTEAFDALLGQRITEIGRRNNYTDQQRIQDMHDMAAELGASCNGVNVPGVMKTMGMSEAWQGASANGKRCYQDLIDKGYSKEKAIAICRSSLKETIDKKRARKVLAYLGRKTEAVMPKIDEEKARKVLRYIEAAKFKSLPSPAKRAYFAKLGTGKAKGTLYKKDPKTGVRKGPGKKKLTRKVNPPPVGAVE